MKAIIAPALVAAIVFAVPAYGQDMGPFLVSAEELAACEAAASDLRICQSGAAKIEVELTRRLVVEQEKSAVYYQKWKEAEAQKMPKPAEKPAVWPWAVGGALGGGLLATLITLVAVSL